MKLCEINWNTITEAEAGRLLGVARLQEQRLARAWDKLETDKPGSLEAASAYADWMWALRVEEDLLVLHRCGERPNLAVD